MDAQERFNNYFNDYFNFRQSLIIQNEHCLRKFVRDCCSFAYGEKEQNAVIASEYFFLGSYSCLYFLLEKDKSSEYALNQGTECIEEALKILDDNEYRVLLCCFNIMHVDEDPRETFECIKEQYKLCPTIRLIENNLLNLQHLENVFNCLFAVHLENCIEVLKKKWYGKTVEDACLLLKESPRESSKIKAYSQLAQTYSSRRNFDEAQRCAKIVIDIMGSNLKINNQDPYHKAWAKCWEINAWAYFMKRDFEYAESLLEKGCSLGIPDCYEDLGVMYQYGLGVDIDKEKALSLYKKAYEMGKESIKLLIDNFDSLASPFEHSFGTSPMIKNMYYQGGLLGKLLPYGKGILKSPDGSTYEGDFVGLPSGRGIKRFANGVMYEGEWLQANYNGEGRLSLEDGRKYQGHFRDNTYHGYGKMYYPNGASYEGEWRNGLFHGEGKFMFADGAIYEGTFRLGQKHGKGTLVYENGDRYVGDWQNDNRTGFGIYYWPNAGRHEGYWLNNNRHGYGIAYAQNGSVIREGQWENDKEV